MLKKEYRLIKDQEFKNVFKHGRTLYTPFLTIKIVKNNLTHPRFGFIVSKKISKRAVQRNKLKRRLREIVRLNLPLIKKNVDVVFFTKSSLLSLNFPALKKEVLTLLKRGGILKE